jgi:hypothetical protein
MVSQHFRVQPRLKPYPNPQIRISATVVALQETVKAGLDTIAALAALSWSFMGSLVDIAADFISGRKLPEPDLKSVATAPEPGAVCKIQPRVTIPRTKRGKMRGNEAA